MAEKVDIDPENRALLVELANTRMPFGKYKGLHLIDLPEAYLAWFARNGFPKSKLGRHLESALAIRMNGLEHLVRPLVSDRDGDDHERGK
jgi:uncharacterized protein (DUF3820 family)